MAPSDDLQREQLEVLREIRDRQREAVEIAVPGILACLLAIGYLIWRYF